MAISLTWVICSPASAYGCQRRFETHNHGFVAEASCDGPNDPAVSVSDIFIDKARAGLSTDLPTTID